MNRRTFLDAALFSGIAACASSHEADNIFNKSSLFCSEKSEDEDLIFNKGREAHSEYYTGKIFISPIISKPEYDMFHLIFEPGSYNSWHVHPDADQVLLILDGEGYYQEEGKPKRLIKRGDVINTPANVKHWNGSTPESRLVHLSITAKTGKNHVEWKDLVKPDEYKL